jgi:hypothetical protein
MGLVSMKYVPMNPKPFAGKISIGFKSYINLVKISQIKRAMKVKPKS